MCQGALSASGTANACTYHLLKALLAVWIRMLTSVVMTIREGDLVPVALPLFLRRSRGKDASKEHILQWRPAFLLQTFISVLAQADGANPDASRQELIPSPFIYYHSHCQ
jgi:hypothetical protein